MFKGKKTYLAAAGIVLASGVAWLSGEATLLEAVTAALTGLGLGTLRMGVKDDKMAAQKLLEQSADTIKDGGK